MRFPDLTLATRRLHRAFACQTLDVQNTTVLGGRERVPQFNRLVSDPLGRYSTDRAITAESSAVSDTTATIPMQMVPENVKIIIFNAELCINKLFGKFRLVSTQTIYPTRDIILVILAKTQQVSKKTTECPWTK
jgi:hypothetical protein